MQNEDIKEQVYKIGYDIHTGKITAIFTEDPMLYAIESWIPVPENFDVHEINRPGAGMEWVVLNGVLQKRNIVYTREEQILILRQKRDEECFSFVNRGYIWYESLTENQKDELSSWYRAWLDVTITLTPPAKPLWLK